MESHHGVPLIREAVAESIPLVLFDMKAALNGPPSPAYPCTPVKRISGGNLFARKPCVTGFIIISMPAILSIRLDGAFSSL